MKGNVKFFNEGKGFGFISGEDGKEYFVHVSGLNAGVTLRDNDAVTFDVEQGDRGPKAGNVSLDNGSSSSAPEAEEDVQEESEDFGDDSSDDDSADDASDDEEDKE